MRSWSESGAWLGAKGALDSCSPFPPHFRFSLALPWVSSVRLLIPAESFCISNDLQVRCVLLARRPQLNQGLKTGSFASSGSESGTEGAAREDSQHLSRLLQETFPQDLSVSLRLGAEGGGVGFQS